MVWSQYYPDSSNEVGDLVNSVAQSHLDYLYRKSGQSGTCTMVSYCTDSNFSCQVTSSVFGAKMNVAGKQMWYMGFKGHPDGYVQVIHISQKEFVINKVS